MFSKHKPTVFVNDDLMNAHVGDCLVENYESLINSLNLPNLDDRNVLAAAVQAEAEVIVTSNLRDFPAEKPIPLGVEAVHHDAFVIMLIEENAAVILLALERQQQI